MERIRNNRIRELREARGLSGVKLAELAGISPQYLYDLEKGNKRLNEEVIARLTRIFNVTSDYLLGLTDDPTPPRSGKVITLAAHREDDPMSDLPEEARKSVEEFLAYMRQKYGKKENNKKED